MGYHDATKFCTWCSLHENTLARWLWPAKKCYGQRWPTVNSIIMLVFFPKVANFHSGVFVKAAHGTTAVPYFIWRWSHISYEGGHLTTTWMTAEWNFHWICIDCDGKLIHEMGPSNFQQLGTLLMLHGGLICTHIYQDYSNITREISELLSWYVQNFIVIG